MKEIDELKEFLNTAHGEVTIKVDGMAPHIKGMINDSGMMLAAFACLKSLEVERGKAFDDIVEMMKSLNAIMGYHVNGEIDGKKYD